MTEPLSPRPVVIIGAGWFGRETAALLEALRTGGEFVAAGFADDSAELHGQTVAGLPVLGEVELARERSELGVIVTVGNPHRHDAKRGIVERLGLDRAAT